MTTHGDMVMQFGGMPVGEIVQGNTYFVDNRKSSANDNNTGRNWKEPKLTIQSAIDEAPANSGSRIYIMGSGRILEYHKGTAHHSLTGADLFGVYREQIHIDYNDCGLQLIGLNRPLITGQVGTTQNLDGYIPTIQIGNYDEDYDGPLYCRIKGFHIGGFGDDGDDAADSNRYGVGIAIGQYDDVNYNDDCYSHIIEDCTFRSSNANAAGQTNDEAVHTWIKGWGNEKIVVRRCLFFQGQYAIGFMGSTNNQSMLWKVEDCEFHYQASACLMSSASPLWMDVNRCLFNPVTAETELGLTGGGTGSVIRNSAFPLCDEALVANRSIVGSPAVGTKTGWQLLNCSGQNGLIFTNAE